MKSFTLRRDSDHSILAELRKRGFSQHDFLEKIPSRNTTRKESIVLVTKELQFQGKPMLYIDKKGVFVDSSLFTELKTISIEQLPLKKYAIIGTAKKDIPFELLVRFLITADVICTYVHIGSQMEISFPSNLRAEVRGSHTYFTNDENVASFAFAIEQDHTKTIHCLDMSK